MHHIDLSMEHALDQTKRTKQKEVIDEFDDCNNLWLKLKTALSYLTSKQAKKRFAKYTESYKEFGKVLTLEVPNDTRVGGTKRMFESTLRSLHALKVYAFSKEDFAKLLPTSDKWFQIAEYDAILNEVYRLSMSCQTDTAGYILIAFLRRHYVKLSYSIPRFTRSWTQVMLNGFPSYPTPFCLT